MAEDQMAEDQMAEDQMAEDRASTKPVDASQRGLDEPAAKGLALTGERLPHYAEPVRTPHGVTPTRRRNSVRRTMSIDAHWPDGQDGPVRFDGRARDIATGDVQGAPTLLSESHIEVTMTGREVTAISASPAPARLQALVGTRPGGHLRAILNEAMPQEKRSGTPLYLLLDDLAGAALVSPWAFSRWGKDWYRDPSGTVSPKGPALQGVCIGFRPGSSAVDEEGRSPLDQNASRVVPLGNPDDPAGWHQLPDLPGVVMRRARRIDAWREKDEIHVESHFQDSASAPDGGDRWAVHEYLVRAAFDADRRLRHIEALPGTLPYPDCRVAPMNLQVLIGTPADALRERVLEQLKFTAGCTHLNDVVRSLAEVPILAEGLPR